MSYFTDDDRFTDDALEDLEYDILDDGLEEMRIEQEIQEWTDRQDVYAFYGKYAE